MDKLLKCLKNAELSYYDVDKWENKDIVYKKFDNDILNTVHLYYYYEKDNIYISIRGSEGIIDIINNIDIHKVPFKEINKELNVHNGFYTDFCEIKDFIEEIIKNKSINEIYFSGHSKGAAICTLSSIYIASIFNNIKIYNISFGCPRIGCEKFIKYYNNLLSTTTYLIRTKYDIIPRVPIYDYYDIDNQYIIEDSKLIIYKPDDNLINTLQCNINNHKIDYYINCTNDLKL
jgi:predicted lipase